MSRNVRLALAGSEAGMAGAILLIAWLAVASLFYRHTIWWVPNLFSSTFFGNDSLLEHFSRYTWTGLAFMMAQYTALGAVFAVVFRQDADRFRAMVLGLVTGIGWYYLMFHGVWKSFSPLMLVYSPDRPLLAGHVLYGLWLGRAPLYARRLE